MNLILTSDFPSAPLGEVVERIRAQTSNPRIAWIPPSTAIHRQHFPDAQRRFATLGFPEVESVDIDEDRDDVQLAYLYEFDTIVLADGDAVRLRYSAIRAGLAGRLRQCAQAGRLIIATGGAAQLFTPNVSACRLANESVAAVLADRARYDGLTAVAYELVPHPIAAEEALVDKFRDYSHAVENDVLLLGPGSAIFPAGAAAFHSTGTITRYRKGQIINS